MNDTVVMPRRMGSLPLFVAVLAVVGLAAGQQRSAELGAYKFVAGGAAVLVGVWGILYAVRAGKLPRPLFYMTLMVMLIAVNLPIALILDVSLVDWLHRALIEWAMYFVAISTYFGTRGRRGAVQTAYFIALVIGVIIVGYYFLELRSVRHADMREITKVETEGFWQGISIGADGVLLISLSFPFVVGGQQISGWLRAAFSALFCLGVAVLVSSFSRTMWGTTALTLSGFLVYSRSRGAAHAGPRLKYLLVAGLMGISFLVIFASTVGRGQMAWVSKGAAMRLSFQDRSGEKRIVEAEALLGTMAGQPLTFVTGMGFGNSYTVATLDTGGIMKRTFSHNRWLYLLFTGGLAVLVVGFTSTLSVLSMIFAALSHQPSGGGDPFAVGRTMLAGIGCLLMIFLLASFTQHPIGILVWNVIVGLLFGTACSISELVQ